VTRKDEHSRALRRKGSTEPHYNHMGSYKRLSPLSSRAKEPARTQCIQTTPRMLSRHIPKFCRLLHVLSQVIEAMHMKIRRRMDLPATSGRGAGAWGRGVVGHAAVHHPAAGEGDEQHGDPVREDAETPQNPGDGDGQVVLGQEAVEGVEAVVEEEPALAVLLALVVNIEECLRGGGRSVQAPVPDVNVVSGILHLYGPEGGRADGEDVAKNGLFVAVGVGDARGIGELGELDGDLVVGLLNLGAATFSPAVSNCTLRVEGTRKQISYPCRTGYRR